MENKVQKLLLIENNKADRKNFEQFAEETDFKFEYLIANSVEEAKMILKEEDFDIVLSGYSLGNGNALELLREFTGAPMIIVTGMGDAEIAVKAMKMGAYDYIIKDADGNYLKSLPDTIYEAIAQFQAEKELKTYRGSIHKILVGRTRELEIEIARRKQADEELQKSYSIINQSPAVVFLWKNAEGWPVEYVSRNVTDLFGYTAEEFISGEVAYESVIHPDDLKPVLEEVSIYSKDKERTEFTQEYKIVTKEGKTKWIDDRTSLRRNEKGEITHYQGIVLDITERKKAEEALQKSEAMFKGIFSQAPVGIELFDSKGNLINANQECLNIFGVGQLEEVKGFKLFEDPNISAEAKTQLRNGELVDYESEFDFEAVKKLKLYKTTKSGKCFLRVQITPYEISDSGEKGFAVHVQDITERKRAESQLIESKRMLNDVLNTIPVRVFWKDIDGVYLGCNQLFAKDAGRSNPEEVIGDNDYNMGWAEQAELYRSDDRIVIESGQPKINYEEPQTTPEGKTIWLSTSKIPLRNISGAVYGVLGTYEDITERKQAEEVLRENEEKLRNIIEYSSNLFYSHTPDHILTYLSPKTREFFDCEPDDVWIRWTEFLTENPSNEIGLISTGKAIETGKAQPSYELELVGKKGRKLWVEVNEAPVVEGGQTVAIVGALTDITERKRSEEALQKSKERYRSLYQKTPAMLHSIDQEGRLTNVSKYWLKEMGYSLNEVLGHHSTDFMTEESSRYANEVILPKFYETGSCRDVPYQYVKKNGEVIDTLLSAITENDENGELIHSLSVIIDVTDRKQAEESLRQSEARLRQVIDLVPHYIFAKDHKGRFILANSASAGSMGTTPEEIIGKTELEIAPVKKEAQVFTKDDAEVISSGKPKFIPESRFTDVAGKLHFLQTIKIPFTASGTQNPSVLGVSVDITERRRAEVALKESEEKFRGLIESSSDWIWEVNAKGVYTYTSPKVEEMLGYKPEEVVGKTPFDHMPPEEAVRVERIFKDLVKAGKPIVTLENLNLHKNGRRVVLETSGVPILDAVGNVRGYRGVDRDVTERKQAERELRDSEYLLRESQKVASLGSYVLDMPGSIWKSSPILDDVFGIDKKFNKDISSWLNIVHPEDRAMMQDYFAINVLTNHESFNKEYRIIRINDQQERWVHGLGKLEFNDDGNPIKLIGTIQDITKRKQSEIALQKSEESLKLAQEFGKVGSWDWDILNNKLTWSDQSFIQLGLKPNEIEPTKEVLDNFIHPDDRGLVSVAIEQTLKYDKPYSMETRMIKPDGKEWIMHTKGKVLRNENGNPVRFVGVQQDITERKKAEEAHRESEERFSRLSGAAFEGIVISDGGKIIDVNDQLAKMMGYKPEEIIGKSAMEFVAPESRELVKNKIKSGTEGSYEHFALKNDGSIFPVEVQAKTLPYEGRSFRVTAIRDTTERKKAEEEIRKLSHSVEQSPAIVIITDISGNIEYVNPKFEEVTGYTAKEVIGKNPNILKSGEITPEEYEILWKTIKAGGEWHGEFHNRKKNGELYWESASISAIKNTKGQTTHYIAIKEDITGRKEMDKRLRESHNRLRSLAERLQMIREEERATIAREIHDDLGQSLTALKMDISWVKNNPEMDVEAQTAKFDMMLDLTNSTIQTVKRIATELRPGILDDLGLIPAIEWQAAEFQNRYKIQCNVSINKSDVIIKDEISIAVFRIFQETLTNVARYSGATKVDVNLNFYDDNKLIMEIADNGVGIDEEQINSPKSLGLFGMRERVNILKGEMEIVGEYGKGTKVRILIPVSKEADVSLNNNV